jgi:hypothetical protein
MKNKKFILLIKCDAPYPVSCKWCIQHSYIERKINDTTFCIDYKACTFAGSGAVQNKCPHAVVFNPLLKRGE